MSYLFVIHVITIRHFSFLLPGEIACFHNYRVLHGRQAFQVLQEGERHLEGGFLDWDDVHSRRRMIMFESSNEKEISK